MTLTSWQLVHAGSQTPVDRQSLLNFVKVAQQKEVGAHSKQEQEKNQKLTGSCSACGQAYATAHQKETVPRVYRITLESLH